MNEAVATMGKRLLPTTKTLRPSVLVGTSEPMMVCSVAIGMMTVLNAIPLAEIEPLTPVCSGNSTSLVINLTGTAPWSIDLSDGTSTITYDNILSSPFTSLVAPLVSANYTVTRVSDAYGQNLNHSNTVTLVVKPRPLTSPIIQYGP